MIGYIYMVGTIVFTVYGQLILKWRIVKFGHLPDQTLEKIIFLFKMIFDPFIFSGLFSAFIASMFWMAAMTKFEVSYAYPIILAGLLLLTLALGIILLDETFHLNKMIGALLIITGVLEIYKSTN